MQKYQKGVDDGVVTVDRNGTVRLTPAAWRTMMAQPTVHFVGFKDRVFNGDRVVNDDRVYNAMKVFGRPDFWHRKWDRRAVDEVMKGDVVVFATGDENSAVDPFAFDDSAMQ